MAGAKDGGERVAEGLAREGVRFVFTLCGGHISPLLIAAKRRGLRVVDTRHEATAVFAADAVARLTGVPGVAAVTAGPGLTNTLTAVKNAQLAQSPVVLLGGAAPTVLQGRGALQDIDQLGMMQPNVKWAASARRVRDIPDLLAEAFAEARSGVPGPAFLELPIDVLYPEGMVRAWYLAKSAPRSVAGKALQWYLRRHLDRVFAQGSGRSRDHPVRAPQHRAGDVARAAAMLAEAERPLLLVGSQALLDAPRAPEVAAAVARLGLPVYLSGMARGLLGRDHPLQLRHQRRAALREADLVVLAGVPADFRLDYGRDLRCPTLAVNRSGRDLRLNKRPRLGVRADPGAFLGALAASGPARPHDAWLATLRARDQAREADIAGQAAAEDEAGIPPLALFKTLEEQLPESAVLVGDGGDFVATAAYTLRPRGPLSWLDPGAFGTLGAGAGFALGAQLCRPDAEVWILWGDGASAYGIAECDTFVRHGLPVLGVVGNDGAWAQIARDQVALLGDDVATVLARNDYDQVARGWGAGGRKAENLKEFASAVHEAQEARRRGQPYLINALLAKSDFRKGSISM